MGKWYQIEKVNAPFEPTLKCVTATYTAVNSTTFFVDNAGFRPESNEKSGIKGYAWISDLSKPNHLNLQFPNIPAGSYQVLDTDYDGYTLIYSCSQIVPYLVKQELTWILSRTPTLSEQKRDELRQLLAKNGIKTADDLIFTDQVSCEGLLD